MLDQDLKQQMASAFAHLRSSVKVSAYLDQGESSEQVRALLSDVVASSDKIELVEVPSEQFPQDVRVPSFGVHRPNDEPRVFFAGLPVGHEFTSLVLAVLHVSGHPPRISEDALKVVDGLSAELSFVTYFSQSCQNCPDVVQALNIMAARNPKVRHVAVDGAFFQKEVEERQVMAVPTVLQGGESFGQGRMEIEQILEQVDSASGERRVAEINARDPFDVLIVGGGPAGAAAAIYAARKGISTGIVADRFGGQVLDTLAIENFISVSATQGPELAAALEAHVDSYPVDVMKHQRARRLTPGDLVDIELESGAHLKARSVIVATGARWRDMNVPGEAEYRTKGVTYCPHCDGPLFKGKNVAVVGGGNSGVEAAIDLAGVVKHVTLLEFADSLKADDILQRKLRSLPNVDIVTSAQTTEISGDGKQVTSLKYKSRVDESQHEVDVSGVFVQIGLAPNTDWLKGTVELSRFGEIEVGARGETSVPGVFAAGDVTTTPYKQIIIATGDGAKAALGAFDHLIRVSAPAA